MLPLRKNQRRLLRGSSETQLWNSFRSVSAAMATQDPVKARAVSAEFWGWPCGSQVGLRVEWDMPSSRDKPHCSGCARVSQTGQSPILECTLLSFPVLPFPLSLSNNHFSSFHSFFPLGCIYWADLIQEEWTSSCFHETYCSKGQKQVLITVEYIFPTSFWITTIRHIKGN